MKTAIRHHRLFSFFAVLLSSFLFAACTPPTQPSDQPVSNQQNGDQPLADEDQPPVEEPQKDQVYDTPSVSQKEWPFEFEPDMRFSLWAEGLGGARVLSQKDALGNRWVSRTEEGVITQLVLNEQDEVTQMNDVFKNLNRPHGLAIDPQDPLVLYFAETDKISRVQLYTDAPVEKIIDLPSGGWHKSRTLHFGPDGRLYVSIGSTCDVCIEKDRRFAAVYSMNSDGSDFRPFATGLRNSVFLATHPVTGEIWATEMGRDNLGDDLPPDEINILEEGEDYGWPYCYGDQVRDQTFEPGTEFDCANTIGSHIDLQAHSAPLGLDFFPEEGWPQEYWHDLLVAYHGSWNRTIPTGYKLVRFNLTDQGEYQSQHDFLTGWMTDEGQIIGRPADIVIDVGGQMYITDDKEGRIYKVTYEPEGN